jgi:hypothetical protein
MNADSHVAVVDLRKETTKTLEAVLDVLARAKLTDTQRAAVCLNAAAETARNVPGVERVRGKVINALCDDLRERLQKYLPLTPR